MSNIMSQLLTTAWKQSRSQIAYLAMTSCGHGGGCQNQRGVRHTLTPLDYPHRGPCHTNIL